jgi:hypothetical protein
MSKRSPARRGHERGQVLPLALAFIALFAGVTLAVLNYASRTQSQKQHSEVTAQSDSLAEGGALYGLADANRGDSSCTVGSTGSLTMQGGDVVGYTTKTCQAGSSTSTPAGLAASCTLCLLGATVTDLTSHKGDVIVQGIVAVNTGVSLTQATLQSTPIPGTPPSTPFIGMADTSGCGGSCTPNPTVVAGVSDPLQKTLPPPPCSTWATGCTVQTPSGSTLTPGVYGSLSATSTVLTLKSGVYVVTGGISTAGNGGVVSEPGGGVLIYLACSGYPTPCTPGQVGAGMSMAGNGSFSVSPQPSGPYAGFVIYADRNNASNISAQGNGASLSGTVYAASASLSMGGNGAVSISGRLIAASLDIQVSGRVGTGLSLVGTTSSVSDCWLSEDDVTGTSGATVSTGHALFALACGGGSGITAFNYGSAGAAGPSLAVTTSSLPSATAGQSGYAQTLTASGGTGAITWSIPSGTLPAGLTLNAGTGVISGSVAAGATTTTFTVAATDSRAASATRSLTITVNAAPSVGTSVLAAATRGQFGYLQVLASTGGTGGVTWSITSGSLPSGLSLAQSTGAITGNLSSGATTQTFTVAAADQNGVSGSRSLSITVNVAPSVTTTSLPGATRGQSGYTATLTAGGGTAPVSWSLTSGALPSSLSLAASTGVISGSVGAGATSQTFTVTVTDQNGVTGSASLSITVAATSTPAVAAPSAGSQFTLQHGNSGSLTITGTGFQPGATVTFSGGHFTITGPIVVAGPTRITVPVQAVTNSKGTSDLTVTNPDGGTATASGSMVNT